MSTFRTTVATLVMPAMAAITLSAAVTFLSTFKSINAGGVSFAGKKVAALVITADDSLRVAGEESLARELSMRGMQGVPTYRIAPKEVLAQAETAKTWFERAQIEGVVSLRPVSVDTKYTPSIWVTSNYDTLWGYYGYGYGTTVVISPGSRRLEATAVVETTIYSVPRNELLWAAVTQSTNVRDLPQFMQELVKRSVEVLREQGLAKAQLTPK